jgi:hypothetical protein
MGFIGDAASAVGNGIGKVAGTAIGGAGLLQAAPFLAVGAGAKSLSRAAQQGLGRDLQDITPETQALINAQKARGDQSTQEISDSQMEGAGEQGGQFLNSAMEQGGQKASAMGGNQAALGQALGERAQRTFGIGQSGLKRASDISAQSEQFSRQEQAARNMSAQYQFQAALANKAEKVYQDMRNIRSQVVTGVIGGVGNIVGGAMGAGGGGNISTNYGGGGGGEGAGPTAPGSAANFNQTYGGTSGNSGISSGGYG